MTIPAAQELADDCLRLTRHQPHQVLEWLVDDVLADFGVQPTTAPPEDILEWLFEHAGQYARAVIANPFKDVLGETYETIASRGRRACLGQFFTPDAIAHLMGAVLIGNDPQHAQAREDGQLWTVCEPTCGSGALLLGFLDTLIAAHGLGALRHWSVTGIDLDTLCARMCAAQVLSNVFLHVSNGSQGANRSTETAASQERAGLGELLIYCGNSLGPLERLRVVIHATRCDLSADFVLPALHPARVAMLRHAQRQTQLDAASASASDSHAERHATHGTDITASKGRASRRTSGAPAPAPEHVVADPRARVAHAHVNSAAPPNTTEQVDLFAD